MMAWGNDSSSWDDSVDFANLEEFDFRDIPAKDLVMTTWHENESLAEVYGFAKRFATHPDAPIENTIIVDISTAERGAKLLSEFDAA